VTTTTPIRIPAEDLRRQYQLIKDEVHAAIDAVLPTGKYTLGPFLETFERQFADYCGTKYSAGISSGTEALHLALAACGIGPGDEVITVANTYVATAFAISYVGAKPVFVDIDPVSYNMDMALLERAIHAQTKAVIPVHMYGQPVDMDPLLEMARKHRLWVIEDAAHSHGATYKGRKTGSLGDIGCFSFYPSKNMGAYGDGGAVTLSNDVLYDQIRVLRYMGQHVKQRHEVLGFQQRLDPLQAAILSVKLRHLDEWNRARQRWAALYDRLLADLPVTTPKVSSFGTHVYYVYTICTARRDELMSYLADRGIGTQVMYATPVPMQPAYRSLGYRESDIPIAARYAKEYLCLPMFPELIEEEVHEVAAAIRAFFA
jgi:dTDP-4-amino-4,6-dideoxygalactose transaminase